MSIGEMKLAGSLRMAPSTSPIDSYIEKNTKLFSQILDSQAKQATNKDKLQSSAVELLQLAQLKMLQGLFSIEADSDTDADADALSSGFSTAENLQQLILHRSQIIDKHYAPQGAIDSSTPAVAPPIGQMIDRVAQKLNLSPALIHSVVSAENAYDATAVSPAGAEGLMQLMPDTAAELGVRDSFDPQENLLGGSRYLKQLLDKYAGDLDSALAAYNWGQGNVDRKGLEQMPQETRNYLMRVKSNLAQRV